MEADEPDSAFSWRVEPIKVVRRVAEKSRDEPYQLDTRISIHFTADQALPSIVFIEIKKLFGVLR